MSTPPLHLFFWALSRVLVWALSRVTTRIHASLLILFAVLRRGGTVRTHHARRR
jgi:hypothetical protein